MAVIRIGDHLIDTARRAVTDADGAPIDLRPQVLELLCLLAERAGDVVSKGELFERVWSGLVVTDDSLVQAVGDARRALGDDDRRLIQTVPRRGYRLVATPTPAPATPGPEPVPAGLPHGRPARPRTLALALALLGAALLAGLAWAWASRSPLPAGAHKPALAVLPFRVQGGSADDAAAGPGIAAELIAELARDAAMHVVSSQSSFQADLQQRSAGEIADRLGVRYLVEGTVRRDGDRLWIRTQLIDGRDGRVVWVDDAGPDVAGLADARAALVARIAGSLDASLRHAETRQALGRPAASLDAYWLTMRALAHKHQFSAAGHTAARAEARQALDLDPSFALAWAVRAIVDSTDAQFRLTGRWEDPRPRLRAALEAADRAVQLEPLLPLAHAARADALAGLGDLPAALQAIEAAARLAPADPDVLNVLGGVLLLNDRIDDAVAAMARTRQAFPIAPIHVSFVHGLVAWGARDLDGARQDADSCLARAPRHTGCLVLQISVLAELGRLEEARQGVARLREVAAGVRIRHTLDAFGHAPSLRERRRAALEAAGVDA